MPSKASATFMNDCSGRSAIPRQGCNIDHRNRVCHLDHDIIQRMLKGYEAKGVLKKLIENISKRLDDLTITTEWQSQPDLFQFFASNLSPALIESFFGPLLTEHIDTEFVDDFWIFDSWVAFIAKGAPRWLFPKGFRARDRLLESLKCWRLLTAELESNGKNTSACRGIMRKLEFLKADDWDIEAIAATDLGFITAFSSNPIPTMFWLNYEIFRRPSLLAELRAECKPHLIPGSSSGNHLRFNVSALRDLPLLQSSIAEALRLRNHVFILRYPDESDMVIDEWRIPKGKLVMACSTTSHMNTDLWNTSSQPVDKFWAERFLEQSKEHLTSEKTERQFSTRGLDGIWLPFRGGSQMCPGQLFSKTAISLATALLVTKYDIELCYPEKELRLGWSHFGAGVIRPGIKAPFRIRRRHWSYLSLGIQFLICVSNLVVHLRDPC